MTHVHETEVRLVIRTIARTAIDNEAHWCDLDAAVGDGDFGFSLARGFEAVLAELDTLEATSVGALLQRVGMLRASIEGIEVALMLNGLGGTPISELYIAHRRAHERSERLGLNVRRTYVGEYCTSLDMAGCSLTLVRLDDELSDLLAAPASVPLRIF